MVGRAKECLIHSSVMLPTFFLITIFNPHPDTRLHLIVLIVNFEIAFLSETTALRII